MLLIGDFFIAFLTALSLENVFFTRAMDFTGLYSRRSTSFGQILALGTIATFVTSISSLPVFVINLFLKPVPNFMYAAAVCYLLINSAVFLLVYVLLSKITPKFFSNMSKAIPIAAVNCVTFGSLLISSRMNEYYAFPRFFGYNMGTGIGFTLALLVLWCLKQRLTFCNVPKSFRGLPVLLVAIGIVSLSVFGLTGNQLPA